MFYTDALTLVRELPGWLVRRLSGGVTVTFLRHRGALGDCLMVSALARGLKKARPQWRVAVASRFPALFAHNPNIDESRGWHLLRTGCTVKAGYHREELTGTEHVVAIQWRRLWQELADAGLHDGRDAPAPDGCHPDLFLTSQEADAGKALAGAGGSDKRPLVLLGAGGKLKPTHNREWGLANFQKLADLLAPHARLAQISGDEPLTVNGQNLPNYGRLPIREAAALFQACDAMLVQEGGLMHVAAAVNAPCVSLFGGFVLPSQTGYERQTNLWSKPECSPCIVSGANCAHLKCMVPITPRRVLREIGALLAQRGHPLPEDAYAQAPDTWTPPPFVDKEVLARELAGEASTSSPRRPSA